MVSFRSVRKISSYLVRAKVYSLERTVGSFKCKKSRCQVCLNVNETDTFTSTVTKKTYKINHKFDCSDKCLIYLLTCKKCLIQYVGKTADEFRYRFLETMISISHVCRDIYMNITQALVIVDF